VNDGKAESHAEPVANPEEIEGSVRTPPNGGKYHGKGHQLGKNIAEEELELAVQSAPEHKRSDSYLKHGMSDPERVIENFELFVHLFSLFVKQTFTDWTPTARFVGIRSDALVDLFSNVNSFQPSVQCTEVIASNVTVVGVLGTRLPSC
jgi:hypothetical protein